MEKKFEFNPNNAIIKLCFEGIKLIDNGKSDEGHKVLLKALEEVQNEFDTFIAAYYLSKYESDLDFKIDYLKTTIKLAYEINNDICKSALPSLYLALAKCYTKSNDLGNEKKYYELANIAKFDIKDEGPFYHGTRANLQLGDFLEAGHVSNYDSDIIMNHIYFTTQINGAGLAACLANGTSQPQVYIIEPTGEFENDPNVTDVKFPGNPTRSYRSKNPLKIVGKITDWQRLSKEEIAIWKEKITSSKGKIIN